MRTTARIAVALVALSPSKVLADVGLTGDATLLATPFYTQSIGSRDGGGPPIEKGSLALGARLQGRLLFTSSFVGVRGQFLDVDRTVRTESVLAIAGWETQLGARYRLVTTFGAGVSWLQRGESLTARSAASSIDFGPCGRIAGRLSACLSIGFTLGSYRWSRSYQPTLEVMLPFTLGFSYDLVPGRLSAD